MLVITVVEFTNHNKDDAQCIVDNFIVIYWEIFMGNAGASPAASQQLMLQHWIKIWFVVWNILYFAIYWE